MCCYWNIATVADKPIHLIASNKFNEYDGSERDNDDEKEAKRVMTYPEQAQTDAPPPPSPWYGAPTAMKSPHTATEDPN
jgi:hypothetical protein